MKILPKYSFMLTLLTLRGSYGLWRPPTSLIIWSHQGLVSTVVGRVIFRSFLSCESWRSWLAWVRRVGHGGLKSLLPQPAKKFLPVSSFCLGWPGITFLNQHPRGTYLALAQAAVAPCPGLCGLELPEKTHCRFLGFGGSFIETTSRKRVGWGHVWTFSALGRATTLQLRERLLGAVALWGAFENEIICRGSSASCLLMTIGISLWSSGLTDVILSFNFPQKWKKIFLKCKELLRPNYFLVSAQTWNRLFGVGHLNVLCLECGPMRQFLARS